MSYRIVVSSLMAMLLFPAISSAQATIKVNDDVFFKVGTLIQAWADDAEDPITSVHAKNLFLRRIQLIVGGQVAMNVTFFFETDNPNLGKAPKNLSRGFITQDAFIEWKPSSDDFMLNARVISVHVCPNCA